MLLAVAGLSEDEIQSRTEQLSTGDWSGFPPAEQQALAFARKLTRQPADITTEDIQQLQATFGEARAVDLIWYISWCNYMTRVADALQLPLETENVFLPLPPMEEPPAEESAPGDDQDTP
jgi:alkylhydroperoxidase family enzyme